MFNTVWLNHDPICRELCSFLNASSSVCNLQGKRTAAAATFDVRRDSASTFVGEPRTASMVPHSRYDHRYNPGGVVILGSQCVHRCAQYACAWGTWKASSKYGSGTTALTQIFHKGISSRAKGTA